MSTRNKPEKKHKPLGMDRTQMSKDQRFSSDNTCPIIQVHATHITEAPMPIPTMCPCPLAETDVDFTLRGDTCRTWVSRLRSFNLCLQYTKYLPKDPTKPI